MRNVKIHRSGEMTIAIENGHMMDGVNLIINRYPWVDIDWVLNQSQFYVQDEVKAIVKRHEDDHDDDKTANREVMDKLNKKIMKQREKAVTRFEKYISKQMENPAAKNKNYNDKD